MSRKKVVFFILSIICLVSLSLNGILLRRSKDIDEKIVEENLIVSNLNFQNVAYEEVNKPYDLDERYNEDIKNTNGVTSDMVRVMFKYSALWKAEMDCYYNLLIEKLEEDGKVSLVNSQEAWIVYSNQNNQLIFFCNSSFYGGGSYLTILEAELEYSKYRERAIELMELYNMIRAIAE